MGESEAALNIARQASTEMRWQRRALFLMGLAQVEMGLIDQGERTAEELKALVDEGMNKKDMRLYHHLRGMIALEKKNYRQAIEDFKEANLLLFHPADLLPFTNDHAFFTEALASAYYAAGDLESAQKEFEKISGFSMGILYAGNIYAGSLYMLGKICEERGIKEKARESYQKFLDLWKDADPGHPELDDAKNRLANLGR